MHQILTELGHPQLPTPIQMDNSTTYRIVANKIIPKAMKTRDMRFIGLGIECSSSNFAVTGTLTPKIWQITGQNIIQQHITSQCTKNF